MKNIDRFSITKINKQKENIFPLYSVLKLVKKISTEWSSRPEYLFGTRSGLGHMFTGIFPTLGPFQVWPGIRTFSENDINKSLEKLTSVSFAPRLLADEPKQVAFFTEKLQSYEKSKYLFVSLCPNMN